MGLARTDSALLGHARPTELSRSRRKMLQQFAMCHKCAICSLLGTVLKA